MHFGGRFASGPEEICDLFAEFIQQTYINDVWVPFDPGPEHVPDAQPFGALQFTSDEVESVLQDLDVNKGSDPNPKNRSMITNLLEYASFVLNSIEDGSQVDSKAFDRVRHQLLLNEMSVSIEPASDWDLIC
jgi:hypothetical protein